MKRFLSLLGLLLSVSLRVLAGDRGVIAVVPPSDPPGPTPTTKSITITTGCYCIVHGPERCKTTIRLRGLADEDCPPTPGLPCGHTKALHTDILSGDWARAGGFLIDPRSPGVPTKGIVFGNTPQDPAEHTYMYTAGQASGRFMIQSVATELPPYHYFLTPQTNPSSDCETATTCTLDYRVMVAVTGLKEFQKPILISNVNDQPLPWLRCGLTPCAEGVDDPYNWPEHRRTHWGTKNTLDDLVSLSWAWYNTCSDSTFDPVAGIDVITAPQDLVVSDMSLPYGGLFDIRSDWRPLDNPVGSGAGHWYHRQGIDVDLSRMSVPLSRRCGPRPSNGTYDPLWRQTRIWRDDSLLEDIGLTHPYFDDPGHLKEVN